MFVTSVNLVLVTFRTNVGPTAIPVSVGVRETVTATPEFAIKLQGVTPKPSSTANVVPPAGSAGPVPTGVPVGPGVVVVVGTSRAVVPEVLANNTPGTLQVPVSLIHSLARADVVLLAPATPRDDIRETVVEVGIQVVFVTFI